MSSPAEQEEIRLYSNQREGIRDEVSPEHEELDGQLKRWAWWNQDRHGDSGGLSSIEALYRNGRDGTPPATAPVLDLKSIAIEIAVLKMRSDRLYRPYGDTIRMWYVDKRSPLAIVKKFEIRPRAFQSWMHTARHLMLHHLRIVELR